MSGAGPDGPTDQPTGGAVVVPAENMRATDTATTRAAEALAADLHRVSAAPWAVTAEAARGVVAAYADPGRRYHDVRHLAEVRAGLEELGVTTGAAVLAAWFHDVVHGSSRADGGHGVGMSDEAASAARARADLTRLGADPALVAEVEALVLATATHALPSDVVDADAGAALLDADLWILAAPAQRFDEYCAQVRQEYATVSDADYAVGRIAILSALVDRDHVYTTDAARERWEERARANVATEIARLSPRRAPTR